ncbi:MAG: hypothetical protein QGH39_05655 [Candidatus Thermoplasmatota archaeon]|jgi:hypothetical protein|nr:hypothetical protein [Candidatus Thermoplasmatota archaeon]|tara:strand:- start:622 stop:1113 length:492 start_codon:yes stop_codon:yes gene_type:complete
MNETGKGTGNIKDIKIKISREHPVENTSSNSRRFVLETGTDVDIEKVIDKLKQTIPELGKYEFSINSKSRVFKLQHKEFKLLGRILLLKDLKIKKISEGKYQVLVKYDLPERKAFFWMVLFGLLLGIVPGLLIYFIGRRTPVRTAAVVSPALDRFIQLIQAGE